VELKKLSVILLAVFGLLLCLLGNCQASPYTKFAGTTIIVNFPSHPYYEYAIKLIPEFTKESGIKVEIDKMPLLQIEWVKISRKTSNNPLFMRFF